MAVLFSAPFMQSFLEAWNGDASLAADAAEAGFSAVIGYGFEDDPQPAGVIVVRDGRATAAGAYAGEPLDADLRATPETWEKWLRRPLDPVAVGTALASRQISNRRGDLAAFAADPARARLLVRSFVVLAGVDGGGFTVPVAEQ